MHYPHCNGDNQGDLVITALDAQGAASLYGPPVGQEPEPAGASVEGEALRDSLAAIQRDSRMAALAIVGTTA